MVIFSSQLIPLYLTIMNSPRNAALGHHCVVKQTVVSLPLVGADWDPDCEGGGGCSCVVNHPMDVIP